MLVGITAIGLLLQGAMINDIREISRERLERTFMTNIVGMISLVQVQMQF